MHKDTDTIDCNDSHVSLGDTIKITTCKELMGFKVLHIHTNMKDD